jgi:hypothetical protein
MMAATMQSGPAQCDLPGPGTRSQPHAPITLPGRQRCLA